jgi:hypothetical protein
MQPKTFIRSAIPVPGRVPAAGRTAIAAALLASMAAGSWAAEAVKARNPEALWEISRNYLKDPFTWPTVWKTTPQAQDAADMAGWKQGQAPLVDEPVQPVDVAPAKPRHDWRASEEKRTQNYLAKVGPLFAAVNRPLSVPAEPEATGAAAGPGTHYLAGALLLATPAITAPGEGGRMYPGEARLQYSSANESSILQLFDEVVLSAGKEHGVKPGDLWRTYEVGPGYRSFATGRSLGRLVETNGIVEVVRTGARSSVGRLIKCYGTVSRDTRAAPMGKMQEVTASGYSPLSDAKVAGQVVWVTQGQQLPQPYSFAVVDQGARKGFHIGDMVLFFNRNGGRMTEKVLGNGLVVAIHEESATILIQDLFPGIINRGDFVVAVQTPIL